MTNQKRYQRIYIEISNVCNLKCTFCPEVINNKKIMTPEFFNQILGQVLPYTEEITLHILGEPLNHPQFLEILEIAQARGALINLTTNATLVQKFEQALLSPAIRQINFSLQSFTDNFPQSDCSKYLKNILNFSDLALKFRPDLYLNYRLWDITQNSWSEIENIFFKEICHHYKMEINPRVEVGLIKSKKIAGTHYFHFDSRFIWPLATHQKIPTPYDKIGFCYGGNKQLAIMADGRIVPCCLDKDGEINLGNIAEDNFSKILQSERLNSLVDHFKRGEVIEGLCQKCTFRNRFNKKASKLKRNGGSEAPNLL